MRKTMTPAERFFWKHAGYSWSHSTGETRAQGRRRCAESLAAAEAWAETALTYEWDWDDFQDLGDHEHWCVDAERGQCDGDRHEVLDCLARYKGTRQVAASLGGIIDADATYRRVVEAELASEARAEALDALMEAI